VRSAEMDAQGGWLGTYGQVDGGRVSWQDWIDVMCTVGFAPATEAKQCTIEFVSLGGDAWIRDVRAVAGQRLRD
jgi:hypothetical protein